MKVISSRLTACVLVILLIGACWHFWPIILLQSMQMQQLIYSHFDNLLIALSEHQWQNAWMLMALSLIYGVFHAVGPGHGKVVMASYLSTHRQKLKTSICLTMAAAMMQALVAIALVTVLRFVLTQTAHQVNNNAMNIIHMNSLLVIALGIWLAFSALKKCFPKKPKIHYQQFSYPANHVSSAVLRSVQNHPPQCGCGHHHSVSAEQLADAHNWRDYLALIISIGARPCSGALLVLTVSALMGVYWIGVISAIVMALGTGSTTSALAFITVTARGLMIRVYGNKEVSPYLLALPAAFGALLLIILGVTLYQMPPLAGMPGFLTH
ncbi:nickel/cobalt transporter [Celerinatantimonas diazotrophica]|uniref:Nickel/cobalt efflux system n=1 Tax=Celerinatantimonas diazotrophica TaxID=412034 RepID=A0A4R1KDP3_9GAMM|nr:nickel/cobalt transporter [Celerinatantimonas diazotrophica]TCK62736.1 ABC-type nickel/cobalt efflux system permease component RcnA [Celerinatantimonas diazotrophica]CAG9298366.1 hypothetical protein CEDIAZO_03566 [Celerinatantimonas diazotrophica]